MKIKSIFKKATKNVAKTNVEKLEKKQLEKVIGGTDKVIARDHFKPDTEAQS